MGLSFFGGGFIKYIMSRVLYVHYLHNNNNTPLLYNKSISPFPSLLVYPDPDQPSPRAIYGLITATLQ